MDLRPSRATATRRPALVLLLASAVLLCGARGMVRVEPRWALLIGIDAYDDPSLRLEYADDDARALRDRLVARGDFPESHVVVMTPDQPNPALRPTRNNIIQQLAALETVAGDRIFFAFSGHGVGEERDGEEVNVLLPMDAKIDRPLDTGIAVNYLLTALGKADVAQRFVVLDACRSPAPGSRRAVAAPWLPLGNLDAEGTLILYGTSFGGFSYEDPAARLGVLTSALVAGLDGAAEGIVARDGQISGMELCAYAEDRVTASGRRTGRPQSPRCGGERTRGDFAIVRAPEGVEPIVVPTTWELPRGPSRHVTRFQSTPERATVYVDGNELCTTPCSRELTEGRHTVEMVLARYETGASSVEVGPDSVVEQVLRPTFGTVRVASVPSGLPIAVDGAPAGNTPVLVELEPGNYSVTIAHPAWLPSGAAVDVSAANRREVTLAATPRLGGLDVSAADPAGNALALEVAVDGVAVGSTPWVGELQVGTHRVAVGAETREVRVEAEQVSTARFRVTPTGARGTDGVPIDEAALEEALPDPDEVWDRTRPTGSTAAMPARVTRKKGPFQLGYLQFRYGAGVAAVEGGTARYAPEDTSDLDEERDVSEIRPTLDDLPAVSLVVPLSVGVDFQWTALRTGVDLTVAMGAPSGASYAVGEETAVVTTWATATFSAYGGLGLPLRYFRPWVGMRTAGVLLGGSGAFADDQRWQLAGGGGSHGIIGGVDIEIPGDRPAKIPPLLSLTAHTSFWGKVETYGVIVSVGAGGGFDSF